MKVRVRFAPSPTGYLHIGSLRTALYDFLIARKNGGDFILKIEDTDQKRFVPGAIEDIIQSLDWMGLARDEGVFKKNIDTEVSNKKVVTSKNHPGISEVGDYGPYIQSEKLETYKKYAEELVKAGHAYYCFCEPERLEVMRKEQIAKKQPPFYDRYCLRTVSEEEINKKLKENCAHTIRLKIPKDETIEFEDLIRGKVKFDTNLVDDQILMKSDGFPTYHLANVIDDHDMRTTHVIRGEEWLPSVPKHLLLYRYFGWEPPKFAHLPLLLNPDRSKLSKRQGDVAVEDYIKKGYLKEAINNFVAFLGWNPGEGSTQEIFTLEELIEKFDLSRVHKAGAVFDIKKLDWINSQWIKKISLDNLYKRSLRFLEEKDFYASASEEKKSESYVKKVLEVEKERLKNLSEIGESNQFFFTDITYDKELLRWKDMLDNKILDSLQASKEALENAEFSDSIDITLNNINTELNKFLAPSQFSDTINLSTKDEEQNESGFKTGELYWPLRVALTGEKKSPPPGEVAWVLGKEESIKRIKEAISKIE